MRPLDRDLSHGNAFPDSHPDGHINAHRHTDEHTDADLNVHANKHAHADKHCDSHVDTDAHRDSDAVPNPDLDASTPTSRNPQPAGSGRIGHLHGGRPPRRLRIRL